MSTEVASGMSFILGWSFLCRALSSRVTGCSRNVIGWHEGGPGSPLQKQGLKGKVRTSSQADLSDRSGRKIGDGLFKGPKKFFQRMARKTTQPLPRVHGWMQCAVRRHNLAQLAFCEMKRIVTYVETIRVIFVPGVARGIQREHATKDEFLDARTIIWHLSDLMRNNVASVRKYRGPIKTWSFSSAFGYLAHQVLETTEKVTRIHSLDLTSVSMIHSLG